MDLRGMNLTRMAQSLGRCEITHEEFAEDAEAPALRYPWGICEINA
jgi:hypothetical protein